MITLLKILFGESEETEYQKYRDQIINSLKGIDYTEIEYTPSSGRLIIKTKERKIHFTCNNIDEFYQIKDNLGSKYYEYKPKTVKRKLRYGGLK